MKASWNYAGGILHTAARIRINTLMARFPEAWRSRLCKALGQDGTWLNIDIWGRQLDRLTQADRGGIAPDANDGEICYQAEITAADFARRLRHVEVIARARESESAKRYGHEFVHAIKCLFAKSLLEDRGIADLWPKVSRRSTRAGLLARMCCAKWWRRTLRVLHARTLEACAIDLGLVHKWAGLYCSHDAVKRRNGQNARNAAAMQSVVAVNDRDQAFYLAELAAKGTSNKAIRRAELMTRIAGFELISKELNHVGMMLTMTCPGRMHKMTTAGDVVRENKRWDGTTPREAQQYLSRQWSRMRAAADRAGVEWYGFRIAEPQQDGTPHWHALIFYSAEKENEIKNLANRYFLWNDSPDEAGADKHRLDFERIDPEKGSAVAYVAKYISKNIDGMHVDRDLYGFDAVESSRRVEAWAATWRIRQFQQVGGPPVTVWRELRRLHPDNVPKDAPEELRQCIVAMNLQKTEPGIASAAWRRYVKAQGGPTCKRKAQKVKLLKVEETKISGYGEGMPDKAIGVLVIGEEESALSKQMRIMVPKAIPIMRKLSAEVESERADWVVAGIMDKARAPRFLDLCGTLVPPWTRVNNCTPLFDGDGQVITVGRENWRGQLVAEEVSALAPRVVRRRKLRRFANWGSGGATGEKNGKVESGN